MHNYRPIVIFGVALLLVIGGFWAVLLWSSDYNKNLSERASAPQASSPNVPSESPAQPSGEPKQPPQSTPAPANKPQVSPSPASPVPAPTASSPRATAPQSQALPKEIPKAGGGGIEHILTAALISLAALLALTLRRQMAALKSKG